MQAGTISPGFYGLLMLGLSSNLRATPRQLIAVLSES